MTEHDTAASGAQSNKYQLWWIPGEGLPEPVDSQPGTDSALDPATTGPEYDDRGPGEYVRVAFTRSGVPERIESVSPGPPEDPVDLGAYLASLRAWDAIAPQQPDEQSRTCEPQHTHLTSPRGYVTEVRTSYSLTRTPEEIITFHPNVEGLWPGALVSGQTAVNGLLREIGITADKRRPVRITIDNLATKPSQLVENPDTGTVTDAIKSMVQDVSGGYRSQVFTSREAFSDEEIALNFGFSASYGGFTGGTKVSASRRETMNTVVAYLKETAFTASCDTNRLPNDWMNDAFTYRVLEDLKKAGRIGVENPPLVVSSVTYGRILMFTFTSSESITDITAALNFGYNSAIKVDAELELKYKKIIREAQISLVSVGGSAKAVHELLQTRSLPDYFKELPSLADYAPMGFVLKTLDTNIPARMSETTAYDEIRYEPAVFDLKLEILGLTEQMTRNYWLKLDGKRGDISHDGSIFPPPTSRHRYAGDGTGDPFCIELFLNRSGTDFHMGDAALRPELHRIANQKEYTSEEDVPFAFRSKPLSLKMRLRVTNMAYGNGGGARTRKTDLEKFADLMKRLSAVRDPEEFGSLYDSALDFVVYESRMSTANATIMSRQLRDTAYDVWARAVKDKLRYHQKVASAHAVQYGSDAFAKEFMAGAAPADRRDHGLHVLGDLYGLEAATTGGDCRPAVDRVKAGVKAAGLPDDAVRVVAADPVCHISGSGNTTVLVIGKH
ncbi:thiol-activated cytolysin family protein [Streptomyces sp. NPDC002586]